jgi:hypothetical protein
VRRPPTGDVVVRGEVIPGIEAMRIPGFRHNDLIRPDIATSSGQRLDQGAGHDRTDVARRGANRAGD